LLPNSTTATAVEIIMKVFKNNNPELQINKHYIIFPPAGCMRPPPQSLLPNSTTFLAAWSDSCRRGTIDGGFCSAACTGRGTFTYKGEYKVECLGTTWSSDVQGGCAKSDCRVCGSGFGVQSGFGVWGLACSAACQGRGTFAYTGEC
jgi:hypothetical protein